MKVEPKFLAPCGLYCGVCGVFYATRDNNDKFLERLLAMYQEKISGLEGISIDDKIWSDIIELRGMHG
jgi:hypothetical protein